MFINMYTLFIIYRQREMNTLTDLMFGVKSSVDEKNFIELGLIFILWSDQRQCL